MKAEGSVAALKIRIGFGLLHSPTVVRKPEENIYNVQASIFAHKP